MKYSPVIKLVLIILLLGCLFRMPNGYYQFIRIAGCIGFGLLAYFSSEQKNVVLTVLCVAAAILLNPVFKIHFSRAIWNDLDLILAIILSVWLLFGFFKTRKI